jgi:hypothetical protein
MYPRLIGKPSFKQLREERQRDLAAAKSWQPTITVPEFVLSRTPAPRVIFDAKTLMAAEFPPPKWAVPDVMAEGLNLLAGPPKVGKSWLALNLAVAIAQGGLALGRIDVERGAVLYLALEDTQRRLQSRLGIVLAGDETPDDLYFATMCEAIEEGGAERISAWLDAHSDARLVVVDVLTRVRGRTGDRTSRYDADYEAMAAIKTLADRHSVAFLVVHHTRKAIADDFLDSVSGTHGLAGAADAVLVLARGRGSAQAALKITGRDVEEASHALDFAPDIGSWQLLDGAAADYELGETRRRILRLVNDEHGLTPTQIAERLNIKVDNAKRTVRRMAEDGQLDTDGSGRYFPPLVSPVTPVTLSPIESDSSDTGDSTHGKTGV